MLSSSYYLVWRKRKEKKKPTRYWWSCSRSNSAEIKSFWMRRMRFIHVFIGSVGYPKPLRNAIKENFLTMESYFSVPKNTNLLLESTSVSISCWTLESSFKCMQQEKKIPYGFLPFLFVGFSCKLLEMLKQIIDKGKGKIRHLLWFKLGRSYFYSFLPQ